MIWIPAFPFDRPIQTDTYWIYAVSSKTYTHYDIRQLMMHTIGV